MEDGAEREKRASERRDSSEGVVSVLVVGKSERGGTRVVGQSVAGSAGGCCGCWVG